MLFYKTIKEGLFKYYKYKTLRPWSANEVKQTSSYISPFLENCQNIVLTRIGLAAASKKMADIKILLNTNSPFMCSVKKKIKKKSEWCRGETHLAG